MYLKQEELKAFERSQIIQIWTNYTVSHKLVSSCACLLALSMQRGMFVIFKDWVHFLYT